jgi:hypothetical protein
MSSQSSFPSTPEKKLRELLSQDESPNLDFKKEIHDIDNPNSYIQQQAIDELVKDVIALANGNAVFAGETAHLVFGANDTKDESGKRPISDIGNHRLTASRILDIVNSACEPKIENVTCDQVTIDGTNLLLVTIFPTPYVHETTRRLRPKPKKDFSERTAFIRQEQKTSVATQKERETIVQIKRFRFDEKQNPPGVPFGVLLGGFVGGVMGYSTIKNRHKIPDKPELSVAAGMAGAIFGATIGGMSARTYKDFYEIRAHWHKIPPRWRLPGIVISFGVAFVLIRALSYLLSRILPKPKF